MTEAKTITVNRRARFDYDILETVEAGLALKGTEIKAIREGRVNLSQAFAKPEGGELWLLNAHIAQYSAGSYNNHDPIRPRKLLVHKDEARRLSSQVEQKGYTIVPLRLYIKGRLAKVELGLARGRRQYDKRQALINREREREAQTALRR
jgi:SsrA-binding protein